MRGLFFFHLPDIRIVHFPDRGSYDNGWEENIHSSLHGENYFCILDEDSQEILSVTLDDAGNYTVNCQGDSETHHLTMATEPGVERTDITYNLTSDIDAAAYLEELKQNPIINNKIMNPVGQCESLMTPVSNFMNKKGAIIFVIEVYLSGVNQQRKYPKIILQWLEIKKEKTMCLMFQPISLKVEV